ncbi:uncharacterized protein LOC131333895 [Rhododendron vialii]|uniref:uncharacterized protein LOC131333895 n=1 Tax=Rhododendron vialii TaxID=182163 RepID=UPI00265EC356|nr:uncharacterized protein LOC131333895 [Rhododendron vialii]XP_058224686.1 uncharacterized protein LOC131333895 [Rhododendron vialii]
MGIEMELEYDKYCRVDGSLETVLPSSRPHSEVDNRRSIKGKLPPPNVLLGLEENFVEINFRCNRGTSRQIIPYPGLEGNDVVDRDSLCQSSTEIRKLKKIGAVEGRRKIDSMFSSDDDSSPTEWKRSSTMLLNQELITDSREDHSAENVEIEKVKDPKFRSNPNVGPISDGNGFQKRDGALISHESLSAKLALPHSPSQSESENSGPSSPKVQFRPFRKMLDPNIRGNSTLRKSLPNDFSNTFQLGSQFVKKDLSTSAVPSSPACLHGRLKLENKHGAPLFEFSLKSPKDLFVARTWKTDNGLNRVYTFHSFQNRRKSSASSGWGLKDSKKASSMVGQMQESSYLCTELKDTAGAFNKSLATEFVLYDIAHARKSVAAHESPKKSSKSGKSPPGPWEPADLHPCLEIAAIVIQVPFRTGESLMFKGRVAKSDQQHQNLLDLSAVNVVTPCGNHGLPSTDSLGPSPLLDRWRSGGGCDCGGWDNGCPLTVFGNPRIHSADDHRFMDNHPPLELFVQGSKENSPALRMRVTEQGWYSVDFHARLSPLQAFSICVAMLHCTKASIVVGPQIDNLLSKCNSPTVFTGEEVTNFLEAGQEKEKRKVSKKIEEIQPSVKLNPPFSPIARV